MRTTRVEFERLRDEYVSDLRTGGRGDAADAVLRDWESFVSFYDFPLQPDLPRCIVQASIEGGA